MAREPLTLELRELAPPRSAPVSLSVGPGEWAEIAHADPEALVAAAAGLGESTGLVALGSTALPALDPASRTRAGLGTIVGQIPPLPALRVLDVILLARPAQPGLSWRAAVGLRQARSQLADDEAIARGLAGRLGLAAWVDERVVGLPPVVAALADVGRVVASRPRAVVWRAPQWLTRDEQETVGAALRAEQVLGGWPVLAVRGAGTPARRGAVVIEVAP